MAENFWFKFYFKDWGDDTRLLSAASKGILIDLIVHLRKNDGQMKVDFRLTQRLTGATTEEIKFAFDEYRSQGIFDFEKSSETEILRSRKITKEIAKSLTNKENGKKGGNPTLKKRLTDSDNRTDNRNPNSIFNYNSNNNSNSKKRKPDKKFVPPTQQEVEVFVQGEGYPYELAVKVYRYYADADWHDSKGNKVRNWKQKIRGVWLKEENKTTNNGKQQQQRQGLDPQKLMEAVARQNGLIK